MLLCGVMCFDYIAYLVLVWHLSRCAMIESKVVSIARVLVVASVSHANSLVGARDLHDHFIGLMMSGVGP